MKDLKKLHQRLDAVEKQLQEIRREHEAWLTKAGPQRPEDSETRAHWPFVVVPRATGRNGSC